MPFVLRLGIAGGIWAIAGGLFFLTLLVSRGGLVVFERVWWVLAVLISIVLVGILSVVTITLYARKPRLASTLVWVGIGGIILAAWGDLFSWGITVSLPAALLLIPAAVKMSHIR